MSWDDPKGFSHGADYLLENLSANNRPGGEKTFPPGLDRALVRFQGDETVKQWFNRCVDSFMAGDIERWRVEEKLAVFAHVAWGPGDELTRASVNVLKTGCGLRDYYDFPERDLETPEGRELVTAVHYLRLDLDYETLGPIGTHPLPHLHFSPDDPPRFVLDAGRSPHVIVDFLDFIYRHFFHGQWLRWAERTWDTAWKPRDPELNPFRRIVNAFKANQIEFLRGNSGVLAEIAEVLGEAKAGLHDLRLNQADRHLMTFPDRL